MSLNPIADIGSMAVTGGVCLVLGLTTGWVTSCVHQGKLQEAAKLAEVKANVVLEKKDAAQGVPLAQAVTAGRAASAASVKAAKAEIPGKTLIITKYRDHACPQEVAKPQDNPTKELSDEAVGQRDVAKFSIDAMRLYDSTVRPGDTQLRAGTYAAAREVEIDEGFSLIAENNGTCAQVTEQLDNLLTRIEQKQQLFKSGSK